MEKKNPPANAGDARAMGSIPGSGRSHEEGNGNPLQYSCWKILWTEETRGLGPWSHKESDRTEDMRMHM